MAVQYDKFTKFTELIYLKWDNFYGILISPK